MPKRSTAISRATPPDSETAGELERARQVYERAKVANEAAAARLEQHRRMLAELGDAVATAERAVSLAGVEMAEQPDSAQARAQFRDAASSLATLDGQRLAFESRLIPDGELAARSAEEELEAGRRGFTRALFLDAVESRLIPADGRLAAALEVAGSALAECLAIREELLSEMEFRPLMMPTTPWGASQNQLPQSDLRNLIPKELIRLALMSRDWPPEPRPDTAALVRARLGLAVGQS